MKSILYFGLIIGIFSLLIINDVQAKTLAEIPNDEQQVTSSTPSPPINRNDLIKIGQKLIEDSLDAINFLKQKNQLKKSEKLQQDVEFLKKLLNDLENFPENNQEEKLQTLLNLIKILETKIQLEIRLAYMDDESDIKEKLLKNAEILLKKIDETLNFLKQQNRIEDGLTLAEDEIQLKNLIEKIQNEDDQIKLINLEMQLENLEFKIQNEINKIYHPDSLENYYSLESMESLLRDVQHLNLLISEDLITLDCTKLQQYCSILQSLSDKTQQLSEQIQKADPKNSMLLNLFQNQYNLLKNQYYQEKRALPYIQQIPMLEEVAEQLKLQIDIDVAKLKANNLNSLANELELDLKNLNQSIEDVKEQTDYNSIVNGVKQIQQTESYLQTKLAELEMKIIYKLTTSAASTQGSTESSSEATSAAPNKTANGFNAEILDEQLNSIFNN